MTVVTLGCQWIVDICARSAGCNPWTCYNSTTQSIMLRVLTLPVLAPSFSSFSRAGTLLASRRPMDMAGASRASYTQVAPCTLSVGSGHGVGGIMGALMRSMPCSKPAGLQSGADLELGQHEPSQDGNPDLLVEGHPATVAGVNSLYMNTQRREHAATACT